MPMPQDFKYTAEHEWLAVDDDIATVGITTFAADALGDVVYVELPAVGSQVVAGEPCGELESTKSVSDLYAPCTGEIVEVNDAVVDDAAQVNVDPYGAGWLFRVRISELPDLLDADAYSDLIAE